MENLIYILLVGPVAWFCYIFYVDWFSYNQEVDIIWQFIPFLVFLGYLALLIQSGPEQSLRFFEDINTTGKKFGGIWTYFIPGVAFTFIIFPQQVCACLESNLKSRPISIRILGCLLVLIVLIRHSMVLM